MVKDARKANIMVATQSAHGWNTPRGNMGSRSMSREAEQSGNDGPCEGLGLRSIPGSPAVLVYRFKLLGSKIASLEIGR